jgi:hypothetical protein
MAISIFEMTIQFLIKVLTNRLTRLRDARVHAEAQGELEYIIKLDLEIAETETTLTQLNTL